MSSRDRQLVYCHECENEWYKEEHGLTCPACHSEFVEELGGNEDPREDLHLPSNIYDDDPDISVPDEHPLRDHNPWDQPHDHMPVDDDHDGAGGNNGQNGGFRITQMPGGFHMEMRRTFTPTPNTNPRAGTGRPPDPFGDIHNNFMSMVNGMMAGGPGARGGFATARTGGRGFGNVSVTTASFGGPGGATLRTQTLHPRDADGPQPGQQPVDDLHRMLGQTLFGGLIGPDGQPRAMNDPDGPGGQGFAMNPFAGIFGLLNPANAAHGDAVFTQEAFDRVMSQLMEQHTMGNAPPPASQQDIASLPKVKITEDMQDPKTGAADCSICMDTVPLGEEVSRLWCGHWFHDECVGSWLREHDSCPQCRKGVAQARDEALGRSSAPPAQGSTNQAGVPPSFSEGGNMSGRGSSSAHGIFGQPGAPSTVPHVPGAYDGYSHDAPRRPSQTSRPSSQGEQQQAPPQGFADRVRGLFTRNSSPPANYHNRPDWQGPSDYHA